MLTIALTAANIITALLAAAFWFAASATKIPPLPDVWLHSDSRIFEPVASALRLASDRNRAAAFLSGIAALSVAASFMCQWLQL